jgi:hypothetical protein
MSFQQAFINQKDSSEVVLFKNAMYVNPKFETFLNYARSVAGTEKERIEFGVLKILYTNMIDSPVMYDFDGYPEFRDILRNVWGNELWDEPVMIVSEITGVGSGLSAHEDRLRQIHWNCVGTTQWDFYKNDEIYKTLIMEPGDVVFIPLGIKHGVKTLTTPRAGMAISLNIPNKAS